jgi:hypothetical protein
MNHRPFRLASLVGLVGCLLGLAPVSAVADPPEEVDQSLLVPTTLNSSFAPFTCKLKLTGPVCTGERHIDTGWEPLDFPCHVPLFGRTVSYRHQTRYYSHDYLQYDARFRQKDIDYVSTSPEGPATATITAHSRFFEPFAVPGDFSTATIITIGTPWDIRPVTGPAVFRAVGTTVEPPGEIGTFAGQVTRDGVSTRYEDAPLDVVLPEEDFFDNVCRAATGG